MKVSIRILLAGCFISTFAIDNLSAMKVARPYEDSLSRSRMVPRLDDSWVDAGLEECSDETPDCSWEMLTKEDAQIEMSDKLISEECGMYRLNDSFKRVVPEILLLNDFSYQLTKAAIYPNLLDRGTGKLSEYAKKDLRDLTSCGWATRAVHGVTGTSKQWFHDIPAVVAQKDNTIVVTFHGSIGAAGMVESPDWQTNLQASKKSGSEIGVRGALHEGYLNKYLQCKAKLYSAIKELASRCSDKGKMKIIVTGHSHGGAMAQVALADLAGNLGKEIFGEDFSNIEHNRFYGFFLSGSRVCGDDESYADISDRIVGKANMFRFNVVDDFVPNVAPGETFSKLLSFFKIPLMPIQKAVKGLLGIDIFGCAGYRSLGHLALMSHGEAAANAEHLHDLTRSQLIKDVRMIGGVGPAALADVDSTVPTIDVDEEIQFGSDTFMETLESDKKSDVLSFESYHLNSKAPDQRRSSGGFLATLGKIALLPLAPVKLISGKLFNYIATAHGGVELDGDYAFCPGMYPICEKHLETGYKHNGGENCGDKKKKAKAK